MGMEDKKNIELKSGGVTSLFQRYFDGDISYHEFLRLKEEQGVMSDEEVMGVMENMWNNFDSREERVPEDVLSTITDRVHKKSNLRIKYWVTAAAVVLLCVGGVLLQNLLYSEPAYEIYATNGNETSEITLPDGSVARLNRNTEIRSFGTDDVSIRRVELLRGEVLFHVTKDAGRTFLVKVGNMEVRVLGTIFNVKDTEESGKVETTLLSGKVKLTQGNEKKGVFLEAGEKAVFDKHDCTFSVEKSQANEDNVWEKAELVFRSTPLPVAFSMIEKYYGIKIVANKTMQKTDTYTSSFEAISLEDLMKILSIHFKFDYKIDDNVVQVNF